MSDLILNLKEDLKKIDCIKNIECVILFGSAVYNFDCAKDLDIIIVVKKIDHKIKDLFFLFEKYKIKIDFDLFTVEEIRNNLSFYNREFKLEYLAKGIPIIGNNIFIEEYKNINIYSYKNSILVHLIDYLQKIRLSYFGHFDEIEKISYLRKYYFRILKGVLLFYGVGDHTYVNNLKDEDVVLRIQDLGFSINTSINFLNLNDLFDRFQTVGEIIVICMKDLKNNYLN